MADDVSDYIAIGVGRGSAIRGKPVAIVSITGVPLPAQPAAPGRADPDHLVFKAMANNSARLVAPARAFCRECLEGDVCHDGVPESSGRSRRPRARLGMLAHAQQLGDGLHEIEHVLPVDGPGALPRADADDLGREQALSHRPAARRLGAPRGGVGSAA